MGWQVYRVQAHDGVAWATVAYLYAGDAAGARSNYGDLGRVRPEVYPQAAALRVEACPTRYHVDPGTGSVRAVAVVGAGEPGTVPAETSIPITELRIVAPGGTQSFPDSELTENVQGALADYLCRMTDNAREHQQAAERAENQAWRAVQFLRWMQEGGEN